MPLMLELVGQQRWADQVRILREVRDDASAAAALVVFSKLMCSYPDAKWARTDAIRKAYEVIGRMFWGPRQTLDEALATIRAWLERTPLPR